MPLKLTLRQQYQADIERRQFIVDPIQANAIGLLEGLEKRLLRDVQQQQQFRYKLRNQFFSPPAVVRGLYLWGGVGRGKTWLMDLFYEHLPIEEKFRTHFHRFMQNIHEQLRTLKHQPDPLQTVAQDIANKTRVLCFDEFFVTDIGDAMILSRLLANLFRQRVSLVSTSNSHPDNLYRGGLHRERFLPAIELLKKHTHVLQIDAGTDYRLRFLDKAEIYHAPLDDGAEKNLQHCYVHIAPEIGLFNTDIELFGRKIHCRQCTDDVAWFEFDDLCRGPRSNTDYIELARCYHTVLISNIPVFEQQRNDEARRFIALVDIFYDRQVNLIVSAAAAADQLYKGKLLAAAFRRTSSRLMEMQSHDYLALPHKP